jgi:hypothetical protein
MVLFYFNLFDIIADDFFGGGRRRVSAAAAFCGLLNALVMP